MFETYIIPVLIFSALGLGSGILLTAASKIFEVKIDERIEKINEVLPQANCGACGFAGCSDYANAIINIKNTQTNLCKPGGTETSMKISVILGTAVMDITPETAVLHCNGNCNATAKKYIFDGVKSCVSAKRLYGGDGLCKYGCIGLGDCASVCTENGITIVNGIANIDQCLCVACGQCVKVCPNSLISIKPLAKSIDVRCSSKDNGKVTKQACINGCIGCKICEKKCLNDAIKVVNFHAVIDYTKCTECGVCYEACPVGCISKTINFIK